MSGLPAPFKKLIDELMRLPGVGEKTATRLAHHLMRAPREHAIELARAITDVREKLKPCEVCGNLTDLDTCAVCADRSRDATVICVVEDPSNIHSMERSQEYRGGYHVLGGVLSPLKGISADDLRIGPLLERVRRDGVTEVIVATNSDVEGEATAHYLLRLLKPLGIRVSRLASGLPVGSDIEYADELTLGRALLGRREM